MTKTFEIHFRDLTPEAQAHLLNEFKTTEEEENWEIETLTILEWEVDDPYP